MDARILESGPPTSGFSSIPFAITFTIIPAVGDEVVGGKNLVSHGPDTAGQNECYGTYDSTTQNGWGPAYQNSCIHSDSNDHSGGNTVWYNYTLATAGTIIDENTSSSNPATNTATPTESVCPKGWTLPTYKQTGSNTNVSSFSPVLGGNYVNGTLLNEDMYGTWWSSGAYNGGRRYVIGYGGSSLYIADNYRRNGYYIRCVSEEKTATDLTYMQDGVVDFFVDKKVAQRASVQKIPNKFGIFFTSYRGRQFIS